VGVRHLCNRHQGIWGIKQSFYYNRGVFMDGILLENWEPIISSGSSRQNCNPFTESIYKKGNEYYINFCHGNESGKLMLDINNKNILVHPNQIRSIIWNELQFYIDSNMKIIISPCYPLRVLKKHIDILKDNFIEIIGNWDGSTMIMYNFHMEKESFMLWNCPRNIKPNFADMFISKYNQRLINRFNISLMFLETRDIIKR
jgi:hypothetical protein